MVLNGKDIVISDDIVKSLIKYVRLVTEAKEMLDNGSNYYTVESNIQRNRMNRGLCFFMITEMASSTSNGMTNLMKLIFKDKYKSKGYVFSITAENIYGNRGDYENLFKKSLETRKEYVISFLMSLINEITNKELIKEINQLKK